MGRSITTATLAGAVALLAATSAFAQSKTLTVAAYGGSGGQTLRKGVIPAFDQKHDGKGEYVAGNSMRSLADASSITKRTKTALKVNLHRALGTLLARLRQED